MAAREVTVALVGRQNAGKTSLLMHLTGRPQRPVNFPGSSVERVEGSVAVNGRILRLVDLPGIGSLESVSRDEEITLEYLRGGSGGPPDALCVVLDAAKLPVELQLLERLSRLGLPMVIALNTSDVARSCGAPVDAEALGDRLGLVVTPTHGHDGTGIDTLRRELAAAPDRPAPGPLTLSVQALAREVVHTGQERGRTWTDRLDAVALHRFWGLPLLAAVVFIAFQLVFTVAEPFVGLVEAGQHAAGGLVSSWVPPGAWRSFLVHGMINGVGSVLVFLPQIALLMVFVALLEGSGYMARGAFLLDRVLRRVGLSGRSFLPLSTSFACAIPGILAARIIDDERDRIATVVVAPLMSCSARMPVYVVLVGAFFPTAWSGVVLTSLYALGICLAALVAMILRRSVLKGGHSLLLMELPVYQRPAWKVVGWQVFSACRSFFITAGTVILATAVVLWALSYYPRPAEIATSFDARRVAAAALPEPERDPRLLAIEREQASAYLEQSYLARAGKTVQPLFAPAGFGWRTTVGILASFPARELIIPTYGTLYSLGDVDPKDYGLEALDGADAVGLRHALRQDLDPVTALALMVFFALCSQCVATLGAIRRETGSWRWPVFTFTYMSAAAWCAAVAVYQVGQVL